MVFFVSPDANLLPMPDPPNFFNSLRWCPHEWSLRFGLSERGLSVVVEGSQAPKPQTPLNLGSDETPHG